MTLREYTLKLVETIANHPEILDLPVIYSIDHRGTSFNMLRVSQPFTYGTWTVDNDKIKAICIN